MPVWGVWLPSDVFWFSCDDTARKARNLRENAQMVVMADSTVEVVSIEGRARAANDADTDAAVATYIPKYGHEMGQPDADIEAFLRSHAGWIMEPERGFGVIETPEAFSAKATRWRWAP